MGAVQRTGKELCSVEDIGICILLYRSYWLNAFLEHANPIQQTSEIKYEIQYARIV
jgi:hypothetical protein